MNNLWWMNCFHNVFQTVLELDKLDLTEPFHKRQEKDLLDQKKEKEETLLLEMLERQQSDGKLNSEKHTERKRRDSKTSLSATKSMSVSSSGAAGSSGKEMRRAKLSRSRSLSSQPTTSKPANSDRPLKVKELSGGSGPGKSSMLTSKDDSLRTAHFTMATLSQTQSTSSMPVLIRSNTTSLLDRTSTLDHRTITLDQRDHRTSTMDQRDHRTITLDQRDHRTSTLDQRDHRTSTLDQRENRTSTLDQRSKSIDQRSSGVKDSQSRKLSINRKSNSFSVQSGREWQRWHHHTSTRPSANQQPGTGFHSGHYPQCNRTSISALLSTVSSDDLILSPDWFSKLHIQTVLCSYWVVLHLLTPDWLDRCGLGLLPVLLVKVL